MTTICMWTVVLYALYRGVDTRCQRRKFLFVGATTFI